MAQKPADNSLIWRAKSVDELKRLAMTEQGGDLILKIRKFSQLRGISTSADEDVWDVGGTKTMLTEATETTLVSTSVNDTLGGTGANVVQVNGLDADYNMITEFVNMNGTTPVTCANNYLRIYRLRVVFSGTGLKNAGTITATETGGSTTQAQIVAGFAITQMSHFTVPAGYTAFVTHVVMSCFRTSGSGAREAEITQYAFSPPANTEYQTLKQGVTNNGGAIVTTPGVPSTTPEKTDIWYKAIASGNNTAVSISQEIMLLKGDFNLETQP